MSLREGTGESGTALGGLVKKTWFKKCDHGCMTRTDDCSNSSDCGSGGVAPPYFPLVTTPLVIQVLMMIKIVVMVIMLCMDNGKKSRYFKRFSMI